MNTSLKAPEGPYFVVLYIGQVCVVSGCHIIVRAIGQTARVKQAMLDVAASRVGRRQDKVVVDEAHIMIDDALTFACVQSKSRKNKSNVAR